MKERIEKYFKIKDRNSSISIELFAGLTTFLSMAYILIVNPNNVLWDGIADPRFGPVFIATALGAFIGTLLMAFVAKSPLAQASAMGLNAICGAIIGGSMGFAYSYGNAMALIFVSGIIFLLLSILPGGKDHNGKKVSLREKIFIGMPDCIKKSISIGVGLFIAFIGLQNAGLIVDNQFTLVDLVKFNDPSLWVKGGIACSAIVALFGLLVIGILSHYKVKGSVIIGILFATLISIPLGVANPNILFGREPGISWSFIENINNYFTNDSVFLGLFRGGFNMPEGSLFSSIMLIISLCMLDMFDTMGTVLGCCKTAKLLDENGTPVNYDKIMISDSTASVIGSLLGTSTVSTFIESSTGVVAGGKTGLTAFTTAILFLLSIFFLPLFSFVPTAAASSALLYVGVLMMRSIKEINFKKPKYAIPSFMTIIITVLGYSITNGIGLGIITFFIMDLIIYFIEKFKGNKEYKLESSFVTIIIVILYLIYFLVPIV